MILLGRLCRCHYASNPAVSAAVRVACLSAFRASPGPCRPSPGPRQLAPPSDPQSSTALLPHVPCGLCPSVVLQQHCPLLSATHSLLRHAQVTYLSDGTTQFTELSAELLSFPFSHSLLSYFASRLFSDLHVPSTTPLSGCGEVACVFWM